MTRKVDDDNDIQSANEALGKEFEKALAEERGEAQKAGREKEIDVDEEDDEEQEREPQEERASRKDRRRERKSQFEAAQRERDEYRRQLEEIRRANDEMRGQLQVLSTQQRPPQEQSQKSMEELALEQAERAIYDIHSEFERLPPQEREARLEEYRQKHIQAERKKDEARFALWQAKQPRQQAPNPLEMYLNAQAPDVVAAGGRGRASLQSHYIRLVQVRGEPDNYATLAKAIDLAREDLGLRRNAPDINKREPGLRQKLAAPSGPQGGSGGDERGRRVVRMGGGGEEEKARRKMAQAMYPKMKPEEAMKRFAKTVLKEQLEAGEIDS